MYIATVVNKLRLG